jgi:hypothetical protein
MSTINSRRLSLADFNIHYPKPDGEDLQAVLPSYEEYRVIVRESNLNEELIPKSLYFQHQRIVHQMMQSPDMDRLLVTHAAGTGKTGTYLGVAQYFKHQWIRHAGDKLNQPAIRRTLFLVSGSPQANDIRRMLVCTFGGSEYLVRGKSVTSQRILIDNLIKKWYEIVPYRIFTARMWTNAKKEGLTTKEYIRKRYAGYLVIIDEFHGLRVKDEKLAEILDNIEGKNLPEDEEYQGLVIESDVKDSDLDYDEGLDVKGKGKGLLNTKSAIKKEMIIEAILNLADFAPNIKLIIGSATLIVNDRDDLKTPMLAILKGELRREFLNLDLTRPSDRRVREYMEDESNLTDEEIRILNTSKPRNSDYEEVMRNIRDRVLEQVLHPYFKNRVSHVESLTGKWIKVSMGDEITIPVGEYGNVEDTNTVDQTIKVYTTHMQGHQADWYRYIYDNTTVTQGKSKIRDIYTQVRQASIFVYPDGRSGNDAFDMHIDRVTGGFGYKFGDKMNKLFDMENDPDKAWKNLRKFSSIYYTICKMLNDNTFKYEIPRYVYDPNTGEPIQIKTVSNIGVVAIYVPYTKGPGAILLGLILERFCGMSRFKKSGRVIGQLQAKLDEEDQSNIVSDYCPTPGSSIIGLKKKSRYAIIHSQVSLSVLDNAKNILKSNDNVNGEYIRVAIIPQEGREGVSINSATAFIRVGFDWNPAENYQAERRVFRENSSDYLIKWITEEIGDPDLIAKYIDNGALKIQVYDMVAVTLDDDNYEEFDTSIGAKIHGNNVRKDVWNSSIRRMIKRFALDCHLNRKRNTLPSNFNGTAECDYKNCDYGCYTKFDPLNTQVITTNYNNMFYDSGSDIIANIIIQFFQVHKETTITYLIRYVERVLGLNGEVFIPILRSLEDLIRRQVEFTNNYGYSTHIMTSKGRVFVSNGNVDNSYYIEKLHGQKGSVSTTIEELRFQTRNELLKDYIDEVKTYGLRPIQVKLNSDDYEDNPFIRRVRQTFYAHPDCVMILEAAIQRSYEIKRKKLNSDPYIGAILYVTRNHWRAIPYPDNAIGIIKERGTMASSQGRKIVKEVPIRYQFKRNDDLFTMSQVTHIVHDLAAWDPNSQNPLSKFYNADGPFRVARISRAKWIWHEYRIDSTRLITYHAIREAFYREVTQKLFNKNNNMIIQGSDDDDDGIPLYGIVLGNNKMVVIDHTPSHASEKATKRKSNARLTTSTSKIEPWKKTEESLRYIYQLMRDREPTEREMEKLLVSKNIIGEVIEAIEYHNYIVYL